MGNPQILTLLSGKGGSGKTVIGMSMARVLTEAGYSVLLVDCDYSTHGATYFFEDELENRSNLGSFETVLNQPPQDFAPLMTTGDFWFLPYTLRLGEEILSPETSDLKETFSRILQVAAIGSIDVVILDCQAGVSTILLEALEISTRNLIVLEPDAISTASLRALHLRIGKHLKRSNTWQIFNKITEEERPVYEKIHGGTLFPNLPPLPFDWEVRAAFARAEIPSVIEKRTVFGLGVIRIMKVLFKPFGETLKKFEENSVGEWYKSIEKNLYKLRVERDERLYFISKGKNRARLKRRWTGFVLAITLTAATIAASESVFSFSTIESISGPRVFFYTLGVSFGLGFYTFWSSIHQEEKETTTLQDQEIEALQDLLRSDPTLREYRRIKLQQELGANDYKS